MPFSGATHTINTHTRHHIVKISVVNCSPEAGLLLLHVGTVLVNTKHNFSCVKKTISYQLPKKEKRKQITKNAPVYLQRHRQPAAACKSLTLSFQHYLTAHAAHSKYVEGAPEAKLHSK